MSKGWENFNQLIQHSHKIFFFYNIHIYIVWYNSSNAWWKCSECVWFLKGCNLSLGLRLNNQKKKRKEKRRGSSCACVAVELQQEQTTLLRIMSIKGVLLGRAPRIPQTSDCKQFLW